MKKTYRFLALITAVFAPTLSVLADIQLNIEKPDFSYPQDVIKTAELFLADSLTNATPRLRAKQLLAVSEITRASESIDKLSDKKSITLALDLSDKFTTSDPDLSAMLKAYAADIAVTASNSVAWNRTQLEVRPTDMDRWTRKDFQIFADSLYGEAYDIAVHEAALARFGQSLKIDRLGYKLTPTVRDFIYLKWYDIKSSYRPDRAIVSHLSASDSPLYFYLTIQRDGYQDKMEFCRQNKTKNGSVFALYNFLNQDSHVFYYPDKELYDFLLEMKRAYPDSWITPLIDKQIKNQSRPIVQISGSDDDITKQGQILTVQGQNVDTVKVMVYGWRNYEKMKLASNKGIYTDADYRRQLSFAVHAGIEEKQVRDTFKLPDANYVFVYNNGKDRSVSNFTVMPWRVVSYSTMKSRVVAVFDAMTGKPVSGVDVIIKYYEGKRQLSVKKVTDRGGLARFDGGVEGSIWLGDKSKGLLFKSGCYLDDCYNESVNNSDDVRFSIAVDRSVYRPGQTLKWTAVAMSRESTVEGVQVRADITYPVPNGGYKNLPDTTFMVGTTDRYGRVESEFIIPDDVATGIASICINGENKKWFNISEFKLRDLQIKDVKTVVSADSVTLTGRMVNYAGVGLSGIDVSLTAETYINGVDSNYVYNATSVENGQFRFNFARNDSSNRRYVPIVLHASSPDGRAADSYTSYPTKYDVSVNASVDNPVDVSKGMKVKVSGVDYSKTDKQTEFAVAWRLTANNDGKPAEKPVAEGRCMTGDINIAPMVLSNIDAGEYRLQVFALDCSTDTTDVFVKIYNSEKSGLPDKNSIVWIPDYNIKIADGLHTLSFLVGIRDDNTNLYWMSSNNKSDLKLDSVNLRAGYHTVNIDLKNTTVNNNGMMPIWAVKNGQVYSQTIYYTYKEADRTLKLTCETFRDAVTADSREHWSFVTSLGDKPVSAAVSVNIYNTQLDEFGAVPMLYISPIMYERSAYSFLFGGVDRLNMNIRGKYLNLEDYFVVPDWLYKPLGYSHSVRRAYNKMGSVPSTAQNSRVDFAQVEDAGGVMLDDCVEEEVLTRSYGTANKVSSKSDVDIIETDEIALSKPLANIGQLRTGTALNALWSPILTTGEDGRVGIDFLVPNQTTRWRMVAVAWTTDLASTTLIKTFDAVKPILVAPNLPRFVRVGDKVNLVSAITNTTDTTQTVNYRMEVTTEAQDSPVYSFADGRATIKPRSTFYVTTTCVIDDALALADSIAVTMRADNGTYGDGERRTLPVLTSSALVTESVNFYLNPGDSIYTITSKDNINDATSSLSFTTNPMWTVVESLPKAIESNYDVAPSLVMSLYSAMSAIKIVSEHHEAASLIDVSSARKVRDQAVRKLTELQTSDGGFRWGKWSDRPDMFTTLTVLEWLDEDVSDPKVKELTEKALEYVDNNIHPRNTKIEPNLYYTYVRSAYGKPTTLAGQQIFDATINKINRTWKKMCIEDKSTAAIAMYRTGNCPVAGEIMRSVVQFGTLTADRGLVFHNMRSVIGYATILRALSTVNPASANVDAVRQALLYLRQGMNWGSSAHTAYAVRAITTGSTWVVNRSSNDVHVTVDSKPIAIDSVAAHTGAFDVAIAGKIIDIERTPGTPAYGAFVTRYVAPLSSIEAFSDGEIRIEKNIYALDSEGNRVALDRADVHAGDRLVVSLTVKASRPMTGVILNDMRPAAFEPVQQLSRYSWCGELGYYIENRDSATNIYLYYIPRGTWTIEYDVTVNTTGTFTTGMATATSTVDANLTAHSSSSPLTIAQ